DGSLVSLSVAVSAVDGRTVAVLTFAGPDILGGSLADGNYTLTIRGDRIHDVLGWSLDGDGNGTPGGDRVDAVFRLSGDRGGDRNVDELDQALFDSALGSSAGDPGFLWCFDYNGDGRVDCLDRDQFLLRLGTALSP